MDKKKRIGRPPASWMFKMVNIRLDKQWTDAYEVADIFGLNVNAVKSFFRNLSLKPSHRIENGKARAQFKVKELKEAARLYIEPWL